LKNLFYAVVQIHDEIILMINKRYERGRHLHIEPMNRATVANIALVSLTVFSIVSSSYGVYLGALCFDQKELVLSSHKTVASGALGAFAVLLTYGVGGGLFHGPSFG